MYTDPTGHFFHIVIGAIIGAIIGGITAAVTGGNIAHGFLSGAISGAIFGAIGGMQFQGLVHTFAHGVGGALSGGINAAITGGDIGRGALIGAFSAGASEWLGSNVDFLKPVAGNGIGAYLANVSRRAVIGGLVGGGVSAATGGDFLAGARQGVMTSAIAYTANDFFDNIELVQKLRDVLSICKFGRNLNRVDRAKAFYYHKAIRDTSPGLYSSYKEYMTGKDLNIDIWRAPIGLVQQHNTETKIWLQPQDFTSDFDAIEKQEAFDTSRDYIVNDPYNLYGKPQKIVEEAFGLVW